MVVLAIDGDRGNALESCRCRSVRLPVLAVRLGIQWIADGLIASC